jgi:3-phosphoshikimate 1-carboxyvinyltransferase
MIAIISPSVISGTLSVPASKSAMQRACALGLLHKGTVTIHHPGYSNDEQAAIDIITRLGAKVARNNHSLVIESTGEIAASAEVINCRESALSFRMFVPIAAIASTEITFAGEKSLLRRPMHFIHDLFPKLNVTITSDNGYLPVTVKGPLIAADISINGSETSQYLTGLLFAFAKVASSRLQIAVDSLVSKPYIDLSMQLMDWFGYNVHHEKYRQFSIVPAGLQPSNIEYTVEGDWSSAAFLLVAGAIAGSVNVTGLDEHSVQADKQVLTVLKECGATINCSAHSIQVSSGAQPLQPFDFDATDCPDLFPPLAALAVNCKGNSTIRGVSRLAGKESNRGQTIVKLFRNLGAVISLEDDVMKITGVKKIKAGDVDSQSDHRIAMAAAVAALNADGPVRIYEAEAVAKSYPRFFTDLGLLGASLSLTSE